MYVQQWFGLPLTVFLALTSVAPAQAPKNNNNFTVRCLNRDSTLVEEELGRLNLELELTIVTDKEVQIQPGDFRVAIFDAKLQQLDELAVAIPKDYQRRTFKKGENKSKLTLTFPGPGDLRPGKDFYAAVILTPPGGENVYPALVRLVKFKLGQPKDKPVRKTMAPPEIEPVGAQPLVHFDEKLEVYVGLLKHGNVAERRKAVEALGRIGERAEGAEAAVPFITEGLKAEQYYTRRFAAEALWKLKRDPAAVKAMLTDLKSANWQTRQSAAETLGRFGIGAKGARPALTEALHDTGSFVRSRAALALWQIEKHPDAIPTLVDNLKDSDSRGHISMAAYNLGEIGVEAKAAVPTLREALKNKPPDFSVALALWKINKNAAAIPALVEGLKYPESGWRGDSAKALGVIGADARAAVPALAEALKDEKEYVRTCAIEALGTMEAEAKAAIPALIEVAKPKTQEVIAGPNSAKGYLGLASVRAGLHGEPYVDKLDPGSPAARAGIKSADLFIGVNDTKISDIKQFRAALEKLALNPGDKVTLAIDRAEKSMRITVTASEWPGPDARVPVPGFEKSRVAAAQLLWKLKDPAGLPALVEALKDPYASTGAAESLYGMGAEAKAAMPALLGALKSENQYTRVAVARTLCRLGREKEAVPVLVAELENKDVYWRCAVAFELWRINKDSAAVTVLLEGLKDKDARGTAAINLWQMNRHPAAVPVLVEAVKNGDTRIVHIALEERAAVTALADALKDEDMQVRNSAAQWLKKIDP